MTPPRGKSSSRHFAPALCVAACSSEHSRSRTSKLVFSFLIPTTQSLRTNVKASTEAKRVAASTHSTQLLVRISLMVTLIKRVAISTTFLLVSSRRGACCFSNSECATGLGCEPSGTNDGTCVVRKQIGEGCATSAECDGTAVCNSLTGQCEAVPKVGEACETVCEVEAGCVNDVCVALQVIGSSCAEGRECRNGNCDGGVCSALQGAGDTCNELEASICGGDLYCAATGPSASTCVAWGDEGASCFQGAAANGGCKLPLLCDPTDNTCKPFPTLGEACTVACQPIDEVFCNTTKSEPTCEARIADGGACTLSNDPGCMVGSSCNESTMVCEKDEPRMCGVAN